MTEILFYRAIEEATRDYENIYGYANEDTQRMMREFGYTRDPQYDYNLRKDYKPKMSGLNKILCETFLNQINKLLFFIEVNGLDIPEELKGFAKIKPSSIYFKHGNAVEITFMYELRNPSINRFDNAPIDEFTVSSNMYKEDWLILTAQQILKESSLDYKKIKIQEKHAKAIEKHAEAVEKCAEAYSNYNETNKPKYIDDFLCL